ncbi:hypothetical protein [Stackebrandtia nassauensis]|nr:hypothetical protein [Stackebrandtia nassauensis]
MRQVRARTLSPDKTVTARMTAEGGITVSLELGCLARHDTRSLAREVRAAVSGVLAAWRRAGDQVLLRELEPDALDQAWQTPAGRRLRPFVDALERLEVTGVGRRGVAKVGMTDGKLRVAFRPEALELRESELGAEIDSALISMYDHRSTEAARLYDELVATEKAEA